MLPKNGVAGATAMVSPHAAGADATEYPAKNNTTQAILPLTTTGIVSMTAGAEAFDELLDATTVKAIAKNFAANPAALST